MTPLEPLLRGDATDFERQLLSAVRGERPSARQRARMMRGIGVTSGVALWSATAHAVLASATGKVVIGLGAAALVSLGALPLARERAVAPSAPSVPASGGSAPLASAAPLPDFVVEPATIGVAALVDAPSDLRAQIELLDAAKRAVNRRDGAEALALLATFDQRFPDAELVDEARALRRAARRLGSGRGR